MGRKTIPRQKMTVGEFEAFVNAPENTDRRFELINGEVAERFPSLIHAATLAFLSGYLGMYLQQHPIGYAFVGASFHTLDDEYTVYTPDLSFRADLSISLSDNIAPYMPDLVIEVISENEDTLQKVHGYLRAGSKIVWAVYTSEKTVYVFHLETEKLLIGQPFRIDDTLTGGDVLPGFTLPVRDIFPE